MMSPEAIKDRKRLAFDAARAGKLEEAETILRGLLTTDPRDLGVLLLLGDVVFTAGSRTEAGRFYSSALAVARQAQPSALQPFTQRTPGNGSMFMQLSFKPHKQGSIGWCKLAQQAMVFTGKGFP